MSRDLSLVHPKLQLIIPQIISQCAAQGLPVLVTDGWRSKDEQDKIYAQGRTSPGAIVSNVRWPYSAHNWGVAFDFCRNVRGREYDDTDKFFSKVAAVAKSFGLEWGGDWRNFVDKPHLQLPEFMPGNNCNWLMSCYGTPEAFKKTWAKVVETGDENVKRYNTVRDAPDYARPTLYKLMSKDIILGDGNADQDKRVIDISEDMTRILVWLDRAGNFGK